MVKVVVVVHPQGLGPKEAGKAWYSLDHDAQKTKSPFPLRGQVDIVT